MKANFLKNEQSSFKNFGSHGKKVVVMGLGLHGGGVGVAKFFAKKGNEVLVTDLKKKEDLKESIKALKKFRNIKYIFGRHREQDFKNADLIIKNPAVSNNSKFLKIAKKAGVKIDTDIGIFFEYFPGKKIIGITGTKGKSTTTTLIYNFFKNAGIKVVVAGNIRVSALDVLEKINKKTTAILELSSWQLEGLLKHKKSPKEAIVLNVFPDHLDRYSSFNDYVRAKEIIFRFQNKNDFLALNFDNKECRKMARKALSTIFWFSGEKKVEKGVFIRRGKVFFVCPLRHKKPIYLFSISDIKIPGEHNISNVLAASFLAFIEGIKPKIIRKTIREFKGVPFRLEFIANKKGIRYYNDSTATNPEAAIAALKSFQQKVSLIAGGTDKNLDFKELAKEIARKTKKIVLFKGTATKKLQLLLKKTLPKNVLLFVVDNMKEAVKIASKGLKRGDIVLLSPGAASFGLFKNEFDRGKQFNKIVKNLS